MKLYAQVGQSGLRVCPGVRFGPAKSNCRINYATRRRSVLVESSVSSGNNKNGSIISRYSGSNPELKRSGLGSSNSSVDDFQKLQNFNLGSNIQYALDKFRGNLLYQYYLWRQDTWSDLQLLLGLNLLIFLFGAYIEGGLLHNLEESTRPLPIDPSTGLALTPQDSDAAPQWWNSFYTVVKIVFGQDMPDPSSASLPRQLFACTMVAGGLASFALVLALVEQVVMEVIQENVQQGSAVYETGHIVLLAWCDHGEGMEQVVRILTQICDAYGDYGGTIAVVLTPRDKLEMESLMKRSLPLERRKKTQLVFRCGHPLDPADLRAVSVTTAASVIISGDYDKAETESDSQCVRAAIVVDEMVNGVGTTASAQAFQSTSSALFQMVAEEEVRDNNTSAWQASSVTSMDTSTSTSTASTTTSTTALSADGHSENNNNNNNLKSDSSWWSMDDHDAYTNVTTPKAGTPRIVCQVKGDEALRRLRYACASRVHPVPSKKLNARRLSMMVQQPIAALVLRRFSEAKSNARIRFLPLTASQHLIGKPIKEVGAYLPNASVLGVYHNRSTTLNPPPDTIIYPGDILIICGSNQPAAVNPIQPSVFYDDHTNNSSNSNSNEDGWIPAYASFAEHIRQEEEEQQQQQQQLANDTTTSTQDDDPINSSDKTSIVRSNSPPSPPSHPPPDILYKYYGKESLVDSSYWDARSYDDEEKEYSSMKLYALPKQYLGATTSPVSLLLCGWNGEMLMGELLKEVDHGRQALPPGSNVVMVNTHSDDATALLHDFEQDGVLKNITASYIKADPKSVRSLAKTIDISVFDSCVVLCDSEWQSANKTSSKILSGSKRLRLDAITLMVQLNIRMLLEERKLPDINIITEKITFVNCRFEDTGRLPFGITVNSAAFSARLLTMAASDPRSLQAFDQLGTSCDITTVDPKFLTKIGEKVNYATLQTRASSLSCVLLGFFSIPQSGSGLSININPHGIEERLEPRIWNHGDGRIKLVMLTPSRQTMRRGRMNITREASAAMDSVARL